MKLLVAAEFEPNAIGGGPAIVRQLLKDWPVSELYWWSCFPDRDRPFGQQVAAHRYAAIPLRLYPQVRARRLRLALLETFWLPWAKRHLGRTVQQLKPDVLWLIPHDWSIPPLHAALCGTRLPWHVSLHDYVDVHTNPVRYGRDRCARMARMADELYARATTADAICQEMAEDLRQRTGRTANAIIRFGVEPEDLDAIGALGQNKPKDKLRIGYAGTILVEEVFELFATALEHVRGALGRPVEIHLFGGHSYAQRRWFRPQWMIERGHLPEARLREELRRCHWGFAPMALADDDPRYNRFSFPAKFIACLAAGLPIITLGHPESSVMKMAANYRVGLSSTAADVGALAAELKAALEDPTPWERYGKEIVRCARTEFDAARMRSALYDCLRRGPRQAL